MLKSEGRISHTFADGRLVLVLSGEIDHHSAVILRQRADELIYRARPMIATIDLSGIEFMDSSGLGFIMGRYALMRKLGGTLTLRDPSARVEKILTLAGLERIIKTERTDKNETEKSETVG